MSAMSAISTMSAMSTMSTMSAISEQATFPYNTDIFKACLEIVENMKEPVNFIKYYKNKPKLPEPNEVSIFQKPLILKKIDQVLNKLNSSNNDEEIYSAIRYNLNKVNNKMLLPNDDKLPVIMKILTELDYSKLEHFQKMADMILDKTIQEIKFASIYAKLCFELYPYFIELENTKTNTLDKIYFRQVLTKSYEKLFNTYISQGEDIDKNKIMGLATFISNLYTNKMITSMKIKEYFDVMSAVVEKSPNLAEGISCLIVPSYRTFMKEDPKVKNYFLSKTQELLQHTKLHIRGQFALQNILDKIAEFDN
jgi:hypothetical protein